MLSYKLYPQHVEDIVRIEKECFISPWSKNIILQEMFNPMSHWIIEETLGKVYGYISYYVIGEEYHINNIAIIPEKQGLGIGSKIIEKLIEIAKVNKAYGLTLEVRASNESAIRLYEKYDFSLAGRRPRYYENNEDALIYWLVLGD